MKWTSRESMAPVCQAVPGAQATSTSLVLWKAWVTKLGDFELKVRSSAGVAHFMNIRVQAAK